MSGTISHTIYQSPLFQVGSFRCAPSHPHLHHNGPTNGPLVAFPRTAVRITHENGETVVANPNIVLFYNAQQCYRREEISERGDHCEWFSFAPQVLGEALRPYDLSGNLHPTQPFRVSHAPCSNEQYLRQRLVVEHITNHAVIDKLFVEESVLGVLDGVLQQAHQQRRVMEPVRSRTETQHREIVRTTQELLSRNFDRGFEHDLSLDQIAAQVFISPFALCRIFRQQTGQTIHTYLNQLRLRTSLETVNHRLGRLTELAMDLGYSSHSHFTQAFRAAFGITPSEFYRSLRKPTTPEPSSDYEPTHYTPQLPPPADQMSEHHILQYQISSTFRSIMK